MSGPVELVLRRLEERGTVKKSGGGWKACCPSHSDAVPSLDVAEGADGRVLLTCRSGGCPYESIMGALGLSPGEGFVQSQNGHHPPLPAARAPKPEPKPVDEEVSRRYRQALRDNPVMLAKLAELRGWTVEAIERLGVGLDGERITFENRDAEKRLLSFSRYLPDPGTRGDRPKLVAAADVPRQLFPPPETIDASEEWLFLVEGEPDAVAAWSVGLRAVAMPGTGGWKPEWAERFRGRRVCVVFDCDEPGRKAAALVAADLAGVAREVRILDLGSGREDKSDLTDYLMQGSTPEERAQAGDLVRRMAEVAPRVQTGLSLLLDDLVFFVRRFVVLADTQAHTVALWVVHTWAFDAFDCTPYLWISSAEKRSGKTTLMEILELLCCEAKRADSISEAGLFRYIDLRNGKLTALLDEMDGVFGSRRRPENDGLRRLLNAGWKRGATVIRSNGENHEPKEFQAFCPKAFAGIGRDTLPDTVADRSIEIRLQRKLEGESTERKRHRVVSPQAEPFRERLAAWTERSSSVLAACYPALPDALNDRAMDAWEPLLAIADLAGEEWAARARAAALELSAGVQAQDESIGVQLLADISRVFEEANTDRISSVDLASALAAIETSPWNEWKLGKPINSTGVARLLKRFEIRPDTVRFGTGSHATAKGYLAKSFDDAWKRYLALSTDTRAVTPVTPVYSSQKEVFSSRNTSAPVTALEMAQNPHGCSDVTAVTGRNAEPGVPEAMGLVNTRPAPGDAGYRDFLNAEHEAGRITYEERRDLRLEDSRVKGSRWASRAAA